MIRRLTITLLAVLLSIQLIGMVIGRKATTSSNYTATERPEPARLLSGSRLPRDLTMRIRRIDQGKCTAVVFASPTCPGSAVLASQWDYGVTEPIWVLEGDPVLVEAFKRSHSLSDETTIYLGPDEALSDLGVFATPTWAFLDEVGAVHFVRASSKQPMPLEILGACK